MHSVNTPFLLVTVRNQSIVPSVLSTPSTEPKLTDNGHGRMLTLVIGSERFTCGALEKGTHSTIKLRSNPSEVDSPTHDFSIPFFSDGCPKEFLKFRKNLNRVFTGQNLTTGPQRHAMTQNPLEGQARTRFDIAATQHGNETVENLKSCLDCLCYSQTRASTTETLDVQAIT